MGRYYEDLLNRPNIIWKVKIEIQKKIKILKKVYVLMVI